MKSHHHHHHVSRETSLASFAGVTAVAATLIIAVTVIGPGLHAQAQRAFGGDYAWFGLLLPALGGIAGAALAAARFRPDHGSRQLAEGYGLCLIALGLTLATQQVLIVGLSLVGLGGGLGWAAVILALCLRPTVHLRHLGFWCGLGVGAGYAFCSQPLVLRAAPALQLITAAIAAAMGVAVSFRFRTEPKKVSGSLEYRPVPIVTWLVVLLVLALLDAGAQQLIRHNPEFFSQNWQAAVAMQGNAFVHLCAGVLAGLALDRRQLSWATASALIAMIGAVLLLGGAPRYFPTARVFYTAGATIYATALVYFSARSGRPWLVLTLQLGTICIGAAAAVSTMNEPQPVAGVPLAGLAATAALAYTVRHLHLKRVRATLSELGDAAVPSRRVAEVDEKALQ